jgi:hypothetical protein
MSNYDWDDMDDAVDLSPTLDEADEQELIDALKYKNDNLIIINENNLVLRERIIDFLNTEIYPHINDQTIKVF